MNGEEWLRFNTYLIVSGCSFITVILLMYHFVWKPEMEAHLKKLKNRRKPNSKDATIQHAT